MRAVCWYGVGDVRVTDVPEPTIVNERDAVVKVTTAAICGSDLHLLDGHVPTMREGDIIGHEFMGEVVEVGPGVRNLQAGDRVVVPFNIACGKCYFCQHEMYSQCDDSNPNAWMPEQLYGYSPGGYFGYSHAFGGYAGGQAEYVRVPYADVGHLKVPEGVPDEQALFLGDAFPTGFMGAELCEIGSTDIIAVWGCGSVGQFAIRSAFLLGASRVIAIDRYPARLALARKAGAEVIDDSAVDDVLEAVKEKTGGMGPDAVIDCVGGEAHGEGIAQVYDRAKQALRLESDRPYALRQAIEACRKGGIVSVVGVYGGFLDKFPMGAIVNKSLTLKSGQTHVQKYMGPLLERIQRGEIDPSEIVTHVMPLDEAPAAYRMFRDKADGVVKVLLKP